MALQIVKQLSERRKENKAAAQSRKDLAKLAKQLNNRLISALPQYVMGGKNMQKAVDTVKDLTKKSDLQGGP